VEPRILLLDEPFGALDHEVRVELRGNLRRIHDTLGVTTVFVTHDREEALALADRAVLLDRGRIVSAHAGAPEPARATNQKPHPSCSLPDPEPRRNTPAQPNLAAAPSPSGRGLG
jgi:ABC-type sulfate/molybdate transport systems ATPase subunit